ncbi:MAG: RNA polymerase sigma factor (sigma-70 family) [Candidatus Azotimanducaceae bacterium]|jgi:RNA polymerase sigma factor (sigma-70 family)
MAKEFNAASLMDELATPLVRYLSKKTQNNEDANDLAQEALLRMHTFQQTRDLENAKAFLFKTANNLLIDQLRRTKVHNKYLDIEMLDEQSDEEKYAPSAERTVCAEQELAQIYKTVDLMPEKVKRAFLMHRGKDMTYSQIAEDMGVTTSMVEKYIVQALRFLRKEIA